MYESAELISSPSSITAVRVLVVQDHPLLASAIAKVLDSHDELSVCGIGRSGDEAANLAAKEQPAVVLMDFLLPDMSGPEAAAKVRAAVPKAAIVFHSAEESETALLDAIDAGATAFLTKSATADQIIEAVLKASVGEVLIPVALFAKAIARQRKVVTDRQAQEKLLAEFTPRELEVLRLLAEGHDTGTLAGRLGIAPHTVEWHIRHLIEKLGVHSKLQAVIAAARLGLIELEQRANPSFGDRTPVGAKNVGDSERVRCSYSVASAPGAIGSAVAPTVDRRAT